MKFEAHAKVNLFLHVVGRLENGYHVVETVIQPLALHDVVEVEEAKGVEVSCDEPSVPLNEKNSAYRAVLKLSEESGIDYNKRGVKINIKKGIPLSGGLGGSAVDAAPVLLFLNKAWELNYSSEKLNEISGKISADVAQALYAQPSVGKGIGNELTLLPKLSREYVLLVDVVREKYYAGKNKSGFLYSKIDNVKLAHKKELNEILKGFRDEDWKEIGKNFDNDFEGVVFSDYPEIEVLKEELKKTSPDVCGLSGAGSAVFAFYSKKDRALEAEKKIKEKFNCWTLITETL
jgi:4-diphosphocytidyl-2-C-methyl-D-erythritol kinase